MKRNFIAILFLSVFLSFATHSFAQHDQEIKPINLNLTGEQWREDLRYFAAELPKKHKNAFHSMTREQFETAVKQLNDEIPNLKGEEIFVRFLKLIAMVGDGHTSMVEKSLFNFGIYPLRYYIYKEGVFIQSASTEYGEIVGGKVIKIGNTPIEQVLSQINEIAWGDNYNEQSKKVETEFLLFLPKVLQGLKIAENDKSVSLTVEVNGQQKVVEVKAIQAVQDVINYVRNGKKVNAYDSSTNPKPIYIKDPQNNYWFEYLKDSKVMYVQFNAGQNKSDENIATFFKRVFDFAENNPVDKFVLDVRFNTGGNLGLNTPIITGLIRSKLNERGKLFVIIGRRSFSATQHLVNELEKYSNAIFVGEPTGSSPNLYADPVTFTLPNSKLPFRASTLWHQTNPTDRRIFTLPEIYAEITPDDFRNNRDPVMNEILNYVPGTTFKDLTAEAATNKDIPAFIKKYRSFKSIPKNKYVNTETDINALGYNLLRERKINEAIEVFKLNVESYPNSANVYDSLAEAYLNGGNKEEAIKNYEKALKINSSYVSSLEALRRLKNQ